MKLVLVSIAIGYFVGAAIGFIGGRFIQKKDVEKFKSDYHKLCELKDIRIQKLENKNKAAKEIIRELLTVDYPNTTLEECKRINQKAEAFLKEIEK